MTTRKNWSKVVFEGRRGSIISVERNSGRSRDRKTTRGIHKRPLGHSNRCNVLTCLRLLFSTLYTLFYLICVHFFPHDLWYPFQFIISTHLPRGNLTSLSLLTVFHSSSYLTSLPVKLLCIYSQTQESIGTLVDTSFMNVLCV